MRTRCVPQAAVALGRPGPRLPRPASGGLLSSMPAGAATSTSPSIPTRLGWTAFLESLASTSLATDGDMEQLREILGFNPLSWNSWAGSMALDIGG